MSRTAFAALVVGASGFIAVGCSQSPSLTSPTSAAAVTATASPAAAASGAIPFNGRMQGDDADSDFTSNSVVVTTTGTGNGTLLGAFSFQQVVTVFFDSGTDVGTARWFAANGDELDTAVSGSGHAESPSEIFITDHHTITGGTGRFAGARGSFDVTRVASGVPPLVTSGTFEGTITSPGATH